MEQSTNIHLIPANKEILKQIKDISSNDIYFLSGYLVTAKCSNGFFRGSSTVRNDSGNGACEQLYVEEIKQVH